MSFGRNLFLLLKWCKDHNLLCRHRDVSESAWRGRVGRLRGRDPRSQRLGPGRLCGRRPEHPGCRLHFRIRSEVFCLPLWRSHPPPDQRKIRRQQAKRKKVSRNFKTFLKYTSIVIRNVGTFLQIILYMFYWWKSFRKFKGFRSKNRLRQES